MSRSRHAKPSKAVRAGLQKKKTTSKQAAKHGESGKLNPGKLSQLTQRDGKKEPEDKPPTPPRSLLTRAGAARMNQNRTQVESLESLTSNGFTMALRRSSLSRRLSQSPVVTPRPKKVSPAKSVSKQQCHHDAQDGDDTQDDDTQDDVVAEHSENDCIPTVSPDPENLIGEESLCLVQGEIQEITQSWPQTIEGSQSCPATDTPSGPLEGTHCEGLFALQTSDDVSTSPQECAPLSQRSTPEVTSQKDTSNQFEALGSQINSLKRSDPPLNPMGSESNGFPTSSFKILPELDLKNCMSLDGSMYPTALIRFLLAGSQPDTLGAKLQEETLKTNPDQGGCYPGQYIFGAKPQEGILKTNPDQGGCYSDQDTLGAKLQEATLKTNPDQGGCCPGQYIFGAKPQEGILKTNPDQGGCYPDQDTLGAKPQEETLKTNPDQGGCCPGQYIFGAKPQEGLLKTNPDQGGCYPDQDVFGAKPQKGILKTNPDQGGCYPDQVVFGVKPQEEILKTNPDQSGCYPDQDTLGAKPQERILKTNPDQGGCYPEQDTLGAKPQEGILKTNPDQDTLGAKSQEGTLETNPDQGGCYPDQDTLGAKPQEGTLKTDPDQGGCYPYQLLDAISVLGQAFSALPPQWVFPGANLVPGEALGKVSGPPEDLGAITMLTQQGTMNMNMAAPPGLPVFLPNPTVPFVTYSIPPGPELHSYASCGLEVQGAIPLTSDSGHAPQPPADSEISSIPPAIAATSVQDEKQFCANPSPLNTQGFTIDPESRLPHAPLDLTQGSQATSSILEGGISQVNTARSADVKTTGMSTPVSQASTSSSQKSTPSTVERKKRKPCGVCEPCQQKTNCGECTYCMNRKNSHQICKKRKCEVLKKKPDATSLVQVTKENKRPQREKKPKVLKRDTNNKPVNGPTSESMEDSQCGHGEEQRLDLNSQPLDNVGKNEESMTGIEAENWPPNKKSSPASQVKGDLGTNLTEVGKPQPSEDDKQESQPSPMFPQTIRNGMKNVYCLPTDTNLPINKLDLEEISKVLGNSSSKLLPGPSDGNDAMNSLTSDRSCDHLKGTSDTLLFQKPGLNCQSAADSTIPKNHPNTHSTGCQPQSPEEAPSKEPKDDSPVQPSLLSLMKDRRLTLEQVVAIEALTQLSEAPSENSSPSKPEKGEETDQRTASLLDNCKAILKSVRKDLQDPNIKCLQHQNPEFKLPDSSVTNQTLEDLNSLTAGDEPTLDSSYPLPVESHNPEDCSQALNGDQKLNSQHEPPCQDVPYSQIEEDVAAQLTQLASTINYNHINPDVKNAGSTPGSLAAKNTQQKPSQEKGMTQEKPASNIQNKPSVPPVKPKNKKKAKQTPKTDKRKKEPPLPSSQENHQKQEQLATQYSKMHDIWISSKFQRFGQSGPHNIPDMFGNLPIFYQKLKPITQNNIPLQPSMTFLPLRQIKFTRQSELAKENVKVELPDTLPTCQIKAESSGQAFAEPVDNSQVQPSVNISEKAHPLPQPSLQSNQCANMMPGAAQTQLQLGAQENLVHPIPPTLPGTSPETPLPDPASILRKGNVSSSNGMAGVNAKPEAQAPSHGPRGDSATHSVQTEFFERIKKYLRDPAKFLQPEANEMEEPNCDCNDGGTQKDKGPYYTHLGAGPSVAAVRELMETRYGQKGKAVRIEKVEYTGKEGKSSQGCPVAKCILRRSGSEEKILCLARMRPGHCCATAVMVVVIMLWEGIPRLMADYLYEELTINLRSYSGHPTDRRCTLNENRTCTCQGLNPMTCGASFSFGCSWSMFLNGCKFGRSPNPRKFRLAPNYPLNSYYRRITGSRRFGRRRRMRPVKPRQMFPEHRAQEKKLEELFQKLADDLAPVYKQMAPVAYQNQVKYEDVAGDCRLGTKKGRPFSGVTCCLDFCAHSHRDIHNMINGSTVVCTLLREDVRDTNNPEDEQLHVLPLHRLADTDEFGSREGMEEKIRSGAIEIVQPSRKKQLRFNEPIPRCGKRRTTMMEQNKKPAPAALKRKRSSSSSDNTKSFSSASSTHHPANEEAAACTYNNTASGGFPETSSGLPCTMPSGANVAAGAGTEQPGEAAPLPQPSLPTADTPLSSPSEQLPFLNCAHKLDSCQVEDRHHSEADEPLSGGALSDDQSSEDDEPQIQEYWSDSEVVLLNPSYGGVAIAPIHGSVLIECARRELHATTRVINANRNEPLRMSLVFYQHKGLILPCHGFYFNRIKFESKVFKKKAAERKGPDISSFVANLLCNIPSRIAPTLTRDNVVTVSPYALTHVAGPYNHWI